MLRSASYAWRSQSSSQSEACPSVARRAKQGEIRDLRSHPNKHHAMRKIKALIYALLGGMVAWGYWQRGDSGMAVFIALFTLAVMALTLAPLGRLRISWNDEGITLAAFPKKPQHIRWQDLEKISLDHLGYHITASSGRFKIRKRTMPDDLLQRIKESVRTNQQS